MKRLTLALLLGLATQAAWSAGNNYADLERKEQQRLEQAHCVLAHKRSHLHGQRLVVGVRGAHDRDGQAAVSVRGHQQVLAGDLVA